MAEDPKSEPEDFRTALAQAIADRNLTLERLSARLREAGTPASIATLSYWQTGRSLPTRARSVLAVTELEKILKLPSGRLTQLLPGDVVTRWDPITQIPERQQVEAVLARMGFDDRNPYCAVLVHDHVLVNAERTHQCETTQQVLEAQADGFSRLPLVFRQSHLQDEPPWLDATVGCRLGQVVELEDIGLLACELILPRALRRGELVLVQYQVHWDITHETDADGGVGRALSSTVQYAVTDVTFESEPPDRVVYYHSPHSADDQAPGRVEEELTSSNHLQHVIVDPQPGLHGLAWSFTQEAGQ